MRHLKIFLVLCLLSPSARAESNRFLQKDFVENGVPFVVDMGDSIDQSIKNAAKPVEGGNDDSKFTQDMDEDTPVTHEEIAGEKNLTTSRPWRAPDYSNQETTLGYSSTAFAVPKGLEIPVKFWIDVYSKYTTDQGVLHDSDYIDLIYEQLDFVPVVSRTDIDRFQKERIKLKMVKDAKLKTIALLEKLQKTKDPTSLSPEQKRIWDYFEKIKEPKKFLLASKKNRLRFQLGQKDRMIQGIYFSGRYIEEFEKIFREAGLPIELVRLPFVESSYNVLARSKVGASGLWQIMPYTMKGFMKRDAAIDQRNHPAEATRLAAKLMRINFNMLQSWPLAMTGYNHGPTGVLNLTKKYRTRELGELVQNLTIKKRFGFASRNFYASFLAALEVSSHATQYLGPVTWSQPLDSVDVKLPIAVTYRDLLRWFENDDLKTQIFNPHITRIARTHGRAIPKGVVISVPKSKLETVSKELESPDKLKKAQAAAQSEGRMPSMAEPQPVPYRVHKGDNLRKIAEEFGVTAEDILQANKLSPAVHLKRGQILQIP